jgi:hypothetical protein
MLRAVVVALAVLAVPAAAGAKEITVASVCGPGGCTRLTDHAALHAFMMDVGGMAEAAPATAQRSYVLRTRMGEPGGHSEEWTTRWLPDAGLIVSRDETGGQLFSDVGADLERVLRRAAGDRAAYPARRFVRRDIRPRVVEVVAPPASQPSRASAGGGDGPWWLVGVGAAALVLLGAAGAARARRR